MKNAEKIILLIDTFTGANREMIMDNINRYAMPKLGNITQMDKYEIIQLITGKSYGFVLSWFNNPSVKLPLVDLCKIALQVDMNVFAFLHDNTGIAAGEINQKYDTVYPHDCAEIYIRAFEIHRSTNKQIVVDNLNFYYPLYRGRNQDISKMIGDNTTVYAVKSWFNRGFRARAPIKALCILALKSDQDIDYFDLFK